MLRHFLAARVDPLLPLSSDRPRLSLDRARFASNGVGVPRSPRRLGRTRSPSLAAALASFVAGGLGLAVAGCSSGTTITTAVGPTLITAEPSAFGGNALCQAKAIRRYVVTLVDVSIPATLVTPMGTAATPDATTDFVLPSSAPIDCNDSASFAYIFPGDKYVARIDAYVRDDITPFGGAGSGSPVMIDPNTQQPIAPDFSTTCGDVPPALAGADAAPTSGRTPTLAVSTVNVFLHDCDPLVPTGTTGDAGAEGGLSTEGGAGDAASAASVAVDLTGVLGGMTCGPASGQVDHFVVSAAPGSTPIDGLPAAVPCGQSLTLSGPATGDDIELRVDAFQAGSPPLDASVSDASASDAGAGDAAAPGSPLLVSSTTCSGRAVAGPSRVTCAPLSNTGAVHVSIGPLLAQFGRQCAPSDVQTYLVSLFPAAAGNPTFAPTSCSSDATITSLAVGPRRFTVTGIGPNDGGLSGNLFEACCSTTVEPGRTSEAICTTEPCALAQDAAISEAADP